MQGDPEMSSTDANELPPVAGYVPLDKVREAMGVPATTFEDRVVACGVTVYGHPKDRRRRLLRAEDVVKLTDPQPVVKRNRRRHRVA